MAPVLRNAAQSRRAWSAFTPLQQRQETSPVSSFFGSFVTDNPVPNDVDILIVMDDDFDAGTLSGEAALLFDHQAADAHFGASVFWIRRMAVLGDLESLIEFWQTKRDGGRRGIVEIVEGNA